MFCKQAMYYLERVQLADHGQKYPHELSGGHAASTGIKASVEFNQLVQQVRREGFDPEYLQHVSACNRQHPDALVVS